MNASATTAPLDFIEAIRAAGLNPPDTIKADGKLHRFSTNGKSGDDAGWYWLDDHGIAAGAFGCWRTGIWETWRAETDRILTPTEKVVHRTKLKAVRQEREAEEARRREEAKIQAAAIWNVATPASDDHPYLTAKGVKAFGLRVHQGRLLIPVREGRELHSLQTIGLDSEKLFLPGGRVKGCYFSIGKLCETVCIAEGYATAASVHEATGYAAAVAFNAGNLEAVAKVLRAKLPNIRIILCADNDTATEGNPGLTKATQAARAVNGLIAVPEMNGEKCDFNDLHKAGGPDAVRQRFNLASMPEVKADNDGLTVSLIRGTDLKPEPITWLWRDWLARGKLHVIAGAPGTGKTTIAMAIAATVTAGGDWPDGTRAEPGNVLIWSGEDDPKDTLLPRLMAMGADPSRVYFVGDVRADGKPRPFDPARDMPALERETARIGDVRLLIVDPIVNAVAGDSHKNTETRRSLQPVVDLAVRIGAAALGVSHFSKGTAGRDPVERVTGSVAFGALPRIVFAAAKSTDEDAPARRLFVRSKSNIGPDGGGFGYGLEQREVPGYPELQASCVLWGQPLEGTAIELLAVAESAQDKEEYGALMEVSDWLRDLLTDEGGTMDKRDIIRLARDNGFAERTIYRARDKLGIRVRTTGFGKDKRSHWSILPMLPTEKDGRNGKNGEIGRNEATESEVL